MAFLDKLKDFVSTVKSVVEGDNISEYTKKIYGKESDSASSYSSEINKKRPEQNNGTQNKSKSDSFKPVNGEDKKRTEQNNDTQNKSQSDTFKSANEEENANDIFLDEPISDSIDSEFNKDSIKTINGLNIELEQYKQDKNSLDEKTLNEAKKFFQSCLSEHSESEIVEAFIYYSKAKCYYDYFLPREYKRAIISLRNSIKLVPEEYYTKELLEQYFYEGLALHKPGCNANDKVFIKYLEERVEEAKSSGDTAKLVKEFNHMAMAHANVNNYEKALEICTEAIKYLPYDQSSNFNIAYYYKSLGMNNKAIETYEKILKNCGLSPEQVEIVRKNISDIKSAQKGKKVSIDDLLDDF